MIIKLQKRKKWNRRNKKLKKSKIRQVVFTNISQFSRDKDITSVCERLHGWGWRALSHRSVGITNPKPMSALSLPLSPCLYVCLCVSLSPSLSLCLSLSLFPSLCLPLSLSSYLPACLFYLNPIAYGYMQICLTLVSVYDANEEVVAMCCTTWFAAAAPRCPFPGEPRGRVSCRSVFAWRAKEIKLSAACHNFPWSRLERGIMAHEDIILAARLLSLH